MLHHETIFSFAMTIFSFFSPASMLAVLYHVFFKRQTLCLCLPEREGRLLTLEAKAASGTADLLKAPLCICESSALCWTITALARAPSCSCCETSWYTTSEAADYSTHARSSSDLKSLLAVKSLVRLT